MSEVRATTISNKAGTGPATLTGQSAAKAYGHLVGSGTPAYQSPSLNLSSVTDNGTGDFTHNFTNAMSNTTFTCLFTGTANKGIDTIGVTAFADNNGTNAEFTASSARMATIDTAGTPGDSDYSGMTVFGDLA